MVPHITHHLVWTPLPSLVSYICLMSAMTNSLIAVRSLLISCSFLHWCICVLYIEISFTIDPNDNYLSGSLLLIMKRIPSLSGVNDDTTSPHYFTIIDPINDGTSSTSNNGGNSASDNNGIFDWWITTVGNYSFSLNGIAPLYSSAVISATYSTNNGITQIADNTNNGKSNISFARATHIVSSCVLCCCCCGGLIGGGQPLITNVYYSIEMRYSDLANNIGSSLISPFLYGKSLTLISLLLFIHSSICFPSFTSLSLRIVLMKMNECTK
jgi:hypothetical protein